jgi:hypothetical protein
MRLLPQSFSQNFSDVGWMSPFEERTVKRNVMLFAAGALALGASLSALQAAPPLLDFAHGARTGVTLVQVPPPRVPSPLPPRCRRTGVCAQWGFCEGRYDYKNDRPSFYRCCKRWGIYCGP